MMKKNKNLKVSHENNLVYQETLKSILEATVPELQVLINNISISSLQIYAKILLRYSQKEMDELYCLIEELTKTIDSFTSQEEFELIKRLSELRLAIRVNRIKWSQIHALDYLRFSTSAPLWRLWEGEVCIVIAFALGEINQLNKSADYYKKAISAFERQGAFKKKIRAVHNYATTISHIDKSKYMLKDYLFVYKQAYKLQALDYAGLALANLAHEYQNLGLMRLADRYSKKAVHLAKHNPTTLQYYLVILHRAHILIDLNHFSLAQELMAHCQKAPFPEVQGALLVLNAIINQCPLSKLKSNQKVKVLSGWLERFKASMKRKKVQVRPTLLEEKLILLLSIKDRSMDDIIESLYGNQLEKSHTKNRFFVMLNRIDKKFPCLIQRYKNQIYSIE